MVYLLRVVLVVLMVPLLVIVDASTYAYVGRLPGHVVTGLSVVAGIAAIVWLMRIPDEEADPLHADRHPHG